MQAGDASVSYAQLNQRANRLAHRLLALGVGPGQRVGLASRRGPQLIVSLLAVLKSGAAYVPLDPKYPAERLAYMLADSRLDLLLSETGLLADLPLPRGLTRVDFSACGEELTGYPTTNPPNHAAAADLAYVIYTSGSTRPAQGCGHRPCRPRPVLRQRHAVQPTERRGPRVAVCDLQFRWFCRTVLPAPVCGRGVDHAWR